VQVKTDRKLTWEASRSRDAVGDDEWRVEAIDYESEGEVYVAIFSGSEAKERAEEYAAWKREH
jgi:hypothetical protein